jgi:AraC-like DNA-binding protein
MNNDLTLHQRRRSPSAAELASIPWLQVLKDEVRRERAIELLQRTRKPIKQVAESAGFQNEKSFIRAFKQWTGQTPAAFRDARQSSGKAPM